MRLINCNSFKLEEFHGLNIPDYAILSHTWTENEEVSYDDMVNGKAETKQTFIHKVKPCCEQALKDGLEYAWVDTCCIKKEDSSELSEAINSMCQWYAKAQICYAYLEFDKSDDHMHMNMLFQNCRWFTRGWTLQELLAPVEVMFFSRNWCHLGSRSEKKEQISQITHINLEALNGNPMNLDQFSIAQRLSWASRRNTTRPEDQTYCLLGLMGVNMPPIYGEGAQNAFIRLQECIMKDSDDETLFAWSLPPPGPATKHRLSMFATSVTQFQDSGDFIPFVQWGKSSSYEITNKGLRLKTLVRPYNPNTGTKSPKTLSSATGPLSIALLNCRRSKDNRFLGIVVERIHRLGDQFARSSFDIVSVKARDASKMIPGIIYVRKTILLPAPNQVRIKGLSVGFKVYGIRHLCEKAQVTMIERRPHKPFIVAHNTQIAQQADLMHIGPPPESVIPWWDPSSWNWQAVLAFHTAYEIIFLIVGYEASRDYGWLHLFSSYFLTTAGVWKEFTGCPDKLVSETQIRNPLNLKTKLNVCVQIPDARKGQPREDSRRIFSVRLLVHGKDEKPYLSSKL
jgi:Heterokaryon incompatibility protein (HET)